MLLAINILDIYMGILAYKDYVHVQQNQQGQHFQGGILPDPLIDRCCPFGHRQILS